ncbi:MAG: hypothetical protein KDN05_25300, partial [Verrucomicrobiae bacterium]|nr:hypothetical protein [Verrucomicrobiae bacterium]
GLRIAVFNGGGDTHGGTISQTFITTIGETYELDFDAGIVAAGTGSKTQTLGVTVTGLSTLLDDSVVRSRSGAGTTWSGASFVFTADDTSSTITFTDVSGSSNSDLLLDHVVVTPVIMRTLTVEGTPVGQVYVEFAPPDEYGDTWYWTDFSRNYPEGTEITLTAVDPYITSTYPSKGLEYRFQRWLMDGVEIGTDPEVAFVLDGDRTLTAVYEEAPPVILTQPENV